MKFDKTKPHGQIFGEFGQAKWEQGGRYYDAQFNLLDDNGMPLKKQQAAPDQASADAGAGNAGNPTKDELLAEAKALGITANKNWGEARLIEAIAAKKAEQQGNAGADAGESNAVDAQIDKNMG